MSLKVFGSVNLFIVKGNKLLLGRRQNKGWMDGYLCPPGGHMEEGETPRRAAIRELKEELGLTLQPADLAFLCVADRRSNEHYVAYEFLVKGDHLQPTNAEPDMCSELVWVDIHQLPADVITDFRDIIERGLIGGEKYLELSDN